MPLPEAGPPRAPDVPLVRRIQQDGSELDDMSTGEIPKLYASYIAYRFVVLWIVTSVY